jgi:UDP-N-acetylglucosamine 1-carboxyvinyltransferase
MTQYLEVFGGKALSGKVSVGGAKNCALPLLFATILTSEECILRRVPRIQDIELGIKLLEHFGAEIDYLGDEIKIRIRKLIATEASYSLVKSLRASFWVLGPLLARGGAARVALPGGDIIGARPVDIHLAGLQKMGADIKVSNGIVYATAPLGLRAAEIDLHFPSVGATHQLIMAASLASGTTVLKNAAREPEIVALAEMLNQMGAEINGAGTKEIIIIGQESLGGTNFEIIGDRLEAATYILAALATRGEVCVGGINPEYLSLPLNLLREMGAQIETNGYEIQVKFKKRLKAINLTTGPYPSFATDLQPLFTALLCLAEGESVIEETVFEGRFGFVSELCRMGANIRIQEQKAIVTGVEKLSPAPVDGLDIRAAGALVIAALATKGKTEIHEIQHLRRGYERLEQKITLLGGKITLKAENLDDFFLAGC